MHFAPSHLSLFGEPTGRVGRGRGVRADPRTGRVHVFKRDRKCVFCSRQASSGKGQHVPPESFLDPYPPNLVPVPCCVECNGSLAKDEEYFLAVLCHVAQHHDLVRRIESGGRVERALLERDGLEALITDKLIAAADGRVELQVDEARLQRVARSIAIGLYARRYGWHRRIPECLVEFLHPTIGTGAVGLMPMMTARFRMKRWTSLSGGRIRYAFVRNWDEELVCVMDFFGDLVAVVNFGRGRRPRS